VIYCVLSDLKIVEKGSKNILIKKMWGKVGIYEIFFVILQRILKETATRTRRQGHKDQKDKGT